jgi:ABC-type arginine/histidine transport system permease subunit
MMVYITAYGEGLNPLLEISGWLNIPVTLQSASAKRQVTAYINIFISTLLLIHSTLWVSGVVQISNDTVSAGRIINLFDAASTCAADAAALNQD